MLVGGFSDWSQSSAVTSGQQHTLNRHLCIVSRMRSILITGGAGFIGSHFVRMALEGTLQGFGDVKLIVFDALTYAGNMSNLDKHVDSPRFEFIKADICDAEVLSSLSEEISGVINFAAETHVDRSISDPEIFVKTNVIGVSKLLQFCRMREIRFLQISTDEVYGSLASGFANETFPLNPSSPYSASKASADLLALSYFKTFGSDVVITRCSNNYGPGQYPEKLIPLFINLLKAGKQVPVYGTGLNTRDWVHVSDHCSAIAKVFIAGKSGQIYNIGDVEHLSNLDIVNLMLEELKLPDSRIDFVADRPGHDFRYAIDASKIKSELDWSPHMELSVELRRLIQDSGSRRT